MMLSLNHCRTLDRYWEIPCSYAVKGYQSRIGKSNLYVSLSGSSKGKDPKAYWASTTEQNGPALLPLDILL